MKKWHQRIQHDPPLWSALVNPHFLPRRALHAAMRKAACFLCGRVLDVGCGKQPYRNLLSHASNVTGIEIDTPISRANSRADIFYSGAILPFDDEVFDSIICNQVLEHAKDGTLFLHELHRVLAPDGILVLSVPFVWPEHEQPHDHRRLTSYGLEQLLHDAGFTVLQQYKLVSGVAAIAALLADWIGETLRPAPFVLRIPLRAIMIAPISWLGAVIDHWQRHGNPSLYLDNFVVAQRTAA